MSTLEEITSESQFTSLLDSTPPTAILVLSFHTPWAAPCAQMRTILETLASTYPVTSPPTPRFLSLNAEDLADISESYDVTAVPFLVILQHGKTLETVSGSDARKVRDAVERHAGKAGQSGRPAIPPPLEATPRQPSSDTNTAMTAAAGPNGHQEARNLSSYAPPASDPNPTTTAPPSASTKEELHTRLSSLVKAAPVMLFMKGTPSQPQCGFSRQLVAILRENSVKYGFFNILADDEVRQGLKEFADWPTYPQLWTGGELVGGLDIVSFAFFFWVGWGDGVANYVCVLGQGGIGDGSGVF